MKGKIKAIYAADFETNNSETDCRVWAYGITNIYKEDPKIGTDIEGLFEYLKSEKPKKMIVYFHNLKFDGNFICNYLFRSGYNHSCKTDKLLTEGEFGSMIDNMGQWFKISVKTKGGKVIEFRDSFKKIPMTIAKMPASFGLDIKKGDLDENEEESYNKIRPIGHELTLFEKDYLLRDVLILARSLKFMYDSGLDGLTIAGDAMKKFKELVTTDDFKMLFPPLTYGEDEDIRQAYRGGWTYCLKRQVVEEGLVYDVNSLYPSVLYSTINGKDHFYPIGIPEYYTGKYDMDPGRPLYIQHIRAAFVIRDGFLPILQSNKEFRGAHASYITEQYDTIDLYLTSIDLQLFLKHYRTLYLEYVDGYKFNAIKGLFDEYINHFIKMKIDAGISGNKGLRTIAKLYLNSLYGKFGMSKIRSGKIPTLEESGKLKMETRTYDIELENGEHIQRDYELCDAYRVDVAAFCTAYAREVTITAAQKAHEAGRFCYADTDSIHITGTEPVDIPIHSQKLGFWKNESMFDQAKFIRAKTYCEHVIAEDEGKIDSPYWNVKCAGMMERTKKALLTRPDFLEVFDIGLNTDNLTYTIEKKVNGEVKQVVVNIPGKLRPKMVPGGVQLVDSSFKIKP